MSLYRFFVSNLTLYNIFSAGIIGGYRDVIKEKMKSKVTEECEAEFNRRIKEFALAIHNYSPEKLYSDLKSNGKIVSTYPYSTFKTDFARTKSTSNGFFSQPAIIGPICELLHYPVSALFGGPVTNGEKDREMIEATVNNAIQNSQKEISIPKKRIINNQIVSRAQIVFNIIQGIISSDNSYPEPIKRLFIWYSSNDKSWDHDKEERINVILEKILTGGRGDTYFASPYSIFPLIQNFSDDIFTTDLYWNHCLIIAYQLSCIKTLYGLHQGAKSFKPTRKQKGKPTVVNTSEIRQKFQNEDNSKDLFAEELHNFCTLFDKEINDFCFDSEEMNTLIPILNKIERNFQETLLFLLNPKYEKSMPQSLSGNSAIHYFTRHEPVIINKYTLEITDAEINLLRNNIQLITKQNDAIVQETQPQFLQNANKVDIIPQGNSIYPHKSGQPIHRQTNNPNVKTYERTIVDDMIDADIDASF